jgi:hypothetical protein
MGWNRRCRMIGKKMRAGSDIVDSSSHFPMIGAQLCLYAPYCPALQALYAPCYTSLQDPVCMLPAVPAPQALYAP